MDSTSATNKHKRRFVKTFILLFWGTPLLIAAMNYVVNPLGYFNDLPLAMPMNTTPEIYSSLRYHKAYDVWWYKPEHLVIGSSRVLYGLSDMEGFFDGKAYNNAVHGMQLYEIERSIEHAQTLKPLRSTLFGLDFFAFNKGKPKFVNGFKPSRMATVDMRDVAQVKLWRSLVKDVTEGLLSIDAFNATKERLLADKTSKKAETIIKEDGGWSKMKWKNKTVTAEQQLEHYKQVEGMYIKNAWFANGTKFDLYGDGSKLDIYRNILRFAHEQGIQMRMFATPPHARLLVELDELGLWPCYEQWKRELWKINFEVAKEYNANPFELWDFSGFDKRTTEKIEKDALLEWYIDSAHFSPKFGRLMLAEMLQGKDYGVGTQITDAEVLDNRLSQVRQGLELYRSDEQRLRDIKQHIQKVREGMPQPEIGSCSGPTH